MDGREGTGRDGGRALEDVQQCDHTEEYRWEDEHIRVKESSGALQGDFIGGNRPWLIRTTRIRQVLHADSHGTNPVLSVRVASAGFGTLFGRICELVRVEAKAAVDQLETLVGPRKKPPAGIYCARELTAMRVPVSTNRGGQGFDALCTMSSNGNAFKPLYLQSWPPRGCGVSTNRRGQGSKRSAYRIKNAWSRPVHSSSRVHERD